MKLRRVLEELTIFMMGTNNEIIACNSTKSNDVKEIEKAIEEITGEKVDLIASGRTDAGVHSLGQTANFKTESQIQIEKFAKAIKLKIEKKYSNKISRRSR